MNRLKTFLGRAIVAAFVALPVSAGIQPFLAEKVEIIGFSNEFIGPEQLEVGELGRFLADGEIVKWEVLPPTTDTESYGDHNENFLVSFRHKGVYTVISAIYANNDLRIHTQSVEVVGGSDPIQPGPAPDVANFDPEIAKKVSDWVKKHELTTEQALGLASSFSRVAKEIEAGELNSPNDIVQATAEENRSVDVNEPFLAELQVFLTAMSDAGKLKTTDEHLVVWNSIAKGLIDAAQ